MGWSKEARIAAALARKRKHMGRGLGSKGPRSTAPMGGAGFTKPPLDIADAWAKEAGPILKDEVLFDVSRGTDKKHGKFVDIDTGSTSAYEGTSIRIYEDGTVDTHGDSYGFNDFFGHARGGESGQKHTPQEIKQGLDKFLKSWTDDSTDNNPAFGPGSKPKPYLWPKPHKTLNKPSEEGIKKALTGMKEGQWLKMNLSTGIVRVEVRPQMKAFTAASISGGKLKKHRIPASKGVTFSIHTPHGLGGADSIENVIKHLKAFDHLPKQRRRK